MLPRPPSKVSRYLDCPLCLHKPAPQHGLHVAVAEVLVGLQNLTLHHLLQQKPTKAPVEEGPHVLPVQNVLSSGRKKGRDWTFSEKCKLQVQRLSVEARKVCSQ